MDILRGDGDAKMYLLQKLAAGSLPLAVGVQLEARLAKIAEARAEKRGAGVTAGTLRCKVIGQGGLKHLWAPAHARDPHCEQWQRLLGIADEIRKFIADHPELKRKAAAA